MVNDICMHLMFWLYIYIYISIKVPLFLLFYLKYFWLFFNSKKVYLMPFLIDWKYKRIEILSAIQRLQMGSLFRCHIYNYISIFLKHTLKAFIIYYIECQWSLTNIFGGVNKLTGWKRNNGSWLYNFLVTDYKTTINVYPIEFDRQCFQ